jgi:uncharacterized protein (TIGR00369 family)
MSDYEEISPQFKEALIRRMKTDSPFWQLLGMELVDVKKGWAKVRLPFHNKLVQPLGIAHGGAIFAPADSAVAMALIGLVDRGDSFTTVEMKINYLRPFDGGEIFAEARIVHLGTKTALGEIEVRNGTGDLVAMALATYMIIRKNPEFRALRNGA